MFLTVKCHLRVNWHSALIHDLLKIVVETDRQTDMKNCCGWRGRTGQESKALQEVLADRKNVIVNIVHWFIEDCCVHGLIITRDVTFQLDFLS